MLKKKNQIDVEDIPILKEFKDIFLKEIKGLPLERDIYFTIDLVPGEIPASKDPYRMKLLELTKLKFHKYKN